MNLIRHLVVISSVKYLADLYEALLKQNGEIGFNEAGRR